MIIQDLSKMDEGGMVHLVLEELVGCRQVHKGHVREEVIVLWKGLSSEDATREGINILKEHFPCMDLEDKVCFKRHDV